MARINRAEFVIAGFFVLFTIAAGWLTIFFYSSLPVRVVEGLLPGIAVGAYLGYFLALALVDLIHSINQEKLARLLYSIPLLRGTANRWYPVHEVEPVEWNL